MLTVDMFISPACDFKGQGFTEGSWNSCSDDETYWYEDVGTPATVIKLCRSEDRCAKNRTLSLQE